MECKICGSKWVVNKTHKLCDEHNQIRLHGESRSDRLSKKVSKAPKKFRVKRGPSERALKMIEKDEVTYEEVFTNNPHECEECGESLPDQFRDEDGKVIARWQYSHIVGKGRVPSLRHLITNFNRLCLKCHHTWDFGTQAEREGMKIWKKNCKNFGKYLIK